MLLFEDQWPSDGDLDFNDLTLTYNLVFRMDAQGRVLSFRMTLNPTAVGGIFDNGLGVHFPVDRSLVAQVTRAIGNQAPVALMPEIDGELTVRVSNNLRELFGGRPGQINASGLQATQQGEAIEFEVVFNGPTAFSLANAPYDTFIFRSDDPTHEIHRPEYNGTQAMNAALFGSANDASTPSRSFVNASGLPFVLVLPAPTEYPSEGQPISSLFPNIGSFAASGGATHADFYASSVNTAFAFRDVNGLPGPAAIFLGADHEPATTGCIADWGLAVDFGTASNVYAYGRTMAPNGDAIVTGYTSGAFTGETNQGGLDFFVARYDGQTGRELWVTQLGGSFDDIGRDVVVDGNGDIYVVGETNSSFSGQGNAGGADAFVARLGSDGSLDWVRTLGGTGEDVGYGVAVYGGSVYVGGGSTSTSLPGAAPATNTPASLLAAFGTDGTPGWVQHYVVDPTDPSNYSYTTAVAVDPINGEVYAVGSERRYSQSGMAAESPFVVRHSASNGTVLWAHHIGGNGYSASTADQLYAYGYGVSVDDTGAAYVSGQWYAGSSNGTWGSWTRANGDTSADAFLTKVDSTGNEQWSYSIASQDAADDFGEAVVVDEIAGRIYFTGRTQGTLQGQTSAGGDDYFLASYGFDGSLDWVIQAGTEAQDSGHLAATAANQLQSTAQGITGSLYVIGNTTGALQSPDAGRSDMVVYRHDLTNGALLGQVLASRLGWTVGGWSACPTTCGTGSQTRACSACARTASPSPTPLAPTFAPRTS